MNCLVCGEDMKNSRGSCPRCQFSMNLLPVNEDDVTKKDRAARYRAEIIDTLSISIITYEWNLDEMKESPVLRKEVPLNFPQTNPLDTEKIYWLEEAFAAPVGKKDIELCILLEGTPPSGFQEEEKISISFQTEWNQPFWKTGIRITRDGNLEIFIGDPDGKIISSKFFNIFMWQSLV